MVELKQLREYLLQTKFLIEQDLRQAKPRHPGPERLKHFQSSVRELSTTAIRSINNYIVMIDAATMGIRPVDEVLRALMYLSRPMADLNTYALSLEAEEQFDRLLMRIEREAEAALKREHP